MLFSIPSKIGSPIPASNPNTEHSTIPPVESPFNFNSDIILSIFSIFFSLITEYLFSSDALYLFIISSSKLCSMSKIFLIL